MFPHSGATISDKRRRHALVEIDGLAAKALGLTRISARPSAASNFPPSATTHRVRTIGGAT